MALVGHDICVHSIQKVKNESSLERINLNKKNHGKNIKNIKAKRA